MLAIYVNKVQKNLMRVVAIVWFLHENELIILFFYLELYVREAVFSTGHVTFWKEIAFDLRKLIVFLFDRN